VQELEAGYFKVKDPYMYHYRVAEMAANEVAVAELDAKGASQEMEGQDRPCSRDDRLSQGSSMILIPGT
jgi:hypothetical protein